MTHYAQCNGEALKLCGSCRRNVENNGPSDPHQAMLNPATRGEQCGDWMAIPPPTKPLPERIPPRAVPTSGILRGPAPALNLLAIGHKAAALRVKAKLVGDGRTHHVWVDPKGGIRMRQPYKELLPDAWLVGTYRPDTVLEVLEDDLLDRERELRGREAA